MSSDESEVAQIARLEAQLKEKQKECASTLEEKTAIERTLRQRELSLAAMAKDLDESKNAVARLEQANRALKAQVRDLESERTALGLMKMGTSTNAGGKSVSGSDEVIRLENLLVMKNKEVESLKMERKTLEKIVRDKETQLVKMDRAAAAASSTGAGAGSAAEDAAAHVNHVKKLKMDIVELQEEKKTLLEIQRLKNKAIENLTRQLEEKLTIEERARDLERRLEAREKEVNAQQHMRAEMERLAKMQEAEMARLEGSVIDDSAIRSLEQDKRYLVSEIRKHIEARTAMERTIRTQQARIDQLQSRMDVLAEALADAKRGRRALQSVVVPSAAAAAPLDNHGQDENGHPEANPLPTSESITEQAAGETVEVSLFELVAQEVSLLKSQISDKERLLHEKDDAMEVLSRNMDILQSARAADAKKSKKAAADLEREVAKLREDLRRREEEFRERELAVKKDNAKLKAKLTAKSKPSSSATGAAAGETPVTSGGSEQQQQQQQQLSPEQQLSVADQEEQPAALTAASAAPAETEQAPAVTSSS